MSDVDYTGISSGFAMKTRVSTRKSFGRLSEKITFFFEKREFFAFPLDRFKQVFVCIIYIVPLV